MVQVASKQLLLSQDFCYKKNITLLYCALSLLSFLLSFLVSSTSNQIVVYNLNYSNLDSSNKDIGDVDVENRRMFAALINENMIYKNCPTLLACSLEFQKMPVRSKQEEAILNAIKADENVKELLPKIAPNRMLPVNIKALCIIVAYMLRMNELDQTLYEDLEFILSKAPYLIEQMVQMAMILAMEFKFGRSRKRITARNVLTLIAFSQNLV